MEQEQRRGDDFLGCLLSLDLLGERREYDLCGTCAQEIVQTLEKIGLKESRKINVAVV